MDIRILACDSMGVRSMAVCVTFADQKILVDPGVALAPHRFDLPPTPGELERAHQLQHVLVRELEDATQVVITHFHGDHHPMVEANESQLAGQRVVDQLRRVRLIAKSANGISKNQVRRRRALELLLGCDIIDADGRRFGCLTFSPPMPHGERGARAGNVVMVRIVDEGSCFVHASDTQLLNESSIDHIVQWRADVVFVAGPPLYILGHRPERLFLLEERLRRLQQSCGQLIVDHHIMRSLDGAQWLDHLAKDMTGLSCGADYMSQPRLMLEARRQLDSRPMVG